MKKLLPIVIFIALIGVGAYLFLNKGAQNTGDTTNTEATSQEATAPETFSGTLKEAVKLGIAMKCTYKVEGNEYESFIKGENYRGKIKSAEGKTGEVIIKDNCMWTWTDQEAQGIKTCFEATASESTDVWEQPQGAVGMGVNYTCLPAAVTDDSFIPPSGVKFMDIDALQKSLGN